MASYAGGYLDLASPLHALHWEFHAILNFLLQSKCCQRIADILLSPYTGLKTIFLSLCESLLVMFYSMKAFTYRHKLVV